MTDHAAGFSPNSMPVLPDHSHDDDDADQSGQAQQFDWNQHGFQLDTGDLDAWLNDDDNEPPPLGIHIFRYDSGRRMRGLMEPYAN